MERFNHARADLDQRPARRGQQAQATECVAPRFVDGYSAALASFILISRQERKRKTAKSEIVFKGANQ